MSDDETRRKLHFTSIVVGINFNWKQWKQQIYVKDVGMFATRLSGRYTTTHVAHSSYFELKYEQNLADYFQPHDLLFYSLTVNCIHWISHCIHIAAYNFPCAIFSLCLSAFRRINSERNENMPSNEVEMTFFSPFVFIVFSFKRKRENKRI